MLEIREIRAADARPIRHAVLRPHQQPHEIVFEGDDAPDTLHVGAFEEGRLVGIATVVRQAPEDEDGDEAGSWRVRGMATVPDVRGRGYGAALLERCLEHARAHGGTWVWCNARVGAAGFYRRLGFDARGDAFEVQAIGPHLFMWRALR
jgi:GNAT superfamily N-acetyltransferase